MGRTLAYARVSTRDQNPQLQMDALGAHGYDLLFEEKISGRVDDRSERRKCPAGLREGGTCLFWKWDRFGRSAAHVLTAVAELRGHVR